MGHHNLHYAGDPHAAAGIWGTPSSKANFCEEDYAVSLFIAEFINSLTNIAYIWYAFRYPQKQREGTPWQLDSMSMALVVLGINSFVFHASLHQTTQFCDELSMFLLGGALLYSVYTINMSPGATSIITAALYLVIGLLSVIYIQSADILHHVYSFNTMLGLIGARTMYLVYGTGRPVEERAKLMRMFWKAVAILVVGYTLWHIDLEQCVELRKLRQVVGLPWAWLLELHGWWHVLTALGASHYIRLIRELGP